MKGSCARVIDAFLRLLSIEKFVETLPALLQMTDDNVSNLRDG